MDIGAVHIYDGSDGIGVIGQKSDLIWSVFYDYFINEDEQGNVIHTYMNQEEYMSIQLYNVEGMSIDEIKNIVNEILLRVSVEHGLDFVIAELDPAYKLEGQFSIYETQFRGVEYEYVPALYFTNAQYSQDVRMAYLSYYQVLEYFFVRIQNHNFLDEFNQISMSPIDHNVLRKTLQHYKNTLNERESLKLVLKKGINVLDLKNWINQDENRVVKYCNSEIAPLDLSKCDEKILSKLGERIYLFRCSIAHAKGDVDEYVAIPTLSNDEISREIEMMKYISYEVLKNCSEV